MPMQTSSIPCPYCGCPLRSDHARQCFECGTDWHDPSNIVTHIVVRKPVAQKTELSQQEVAICDEPDFILFLTSIGKNRGKVFAILRQVLGAAPAEVKRLMALPSIEVARGPRMQVEHIAHRFRAAGAEVEWASVQD